MTNALSIPSQPDALPTAVTFLEYWKRKSVSLAHHWDCMGFQEEEQRPRPEFAARAPFLERNPVTGIREPSFPSSLRNKRVAAGIGIIFLMVNQSVLMSITPHDLCRPARAWSLQLLSDVSLRRSHWSSSSSLQSSSIVCWCPSRSSRTPPSGHRPRPLPI
jgi:hypothetical protein